MGNVFLTHLKSIYSKYQKSYATVCQLFKNPVLRPLHLILYKDWQFITYIEKYIQAKVTEEMNKLILSSRLRKQAIDVFMKNFESFSYIEIDRAY